MKYQCEYCGQFLDFRPTDKCHACGTRVYVVIGDQTTLHGNPKRVWRVGCPGCDGDGHFLELDEEYPNHPIHDTQTPLRYRKGETVGCREEMVFTLVT